MVRGTTPTHIFSKLPVLSEEISEIWITYLQGGSDILTKEIGDVHFEDDEENLTCTASVTLSQEDTLSFKPGPAAVQVRLLLKDGTACASDEVRLFVKRIIKDGAIM